MDSEFGFELPALKKMLKCLIWREMANKNRREISFFGGCGISAAVSSLLHIVHTYESPHTKGEPWNSLALKAAALTFQKDSFQ